MVNELIYRGAIGLLFFVYFILFVGVLGAFFVDGIKIEIEADLFAIFHALFYFPFACLLLIALVYSIAIIVSLISGSFPSWFFLSGEYLAKTVIVILVSIGLYRSLENSTRRVDWEKLQAKNLIKHSKKLSLIIFFT
jgi:hypothetical protein